MFMSRHLRRTYRLAFAALAFCLLPAGSEARAAWRAAGDVKTVARQADGVVLTLTSGARVAVTFRDIETVRVRLAPAGTFERDLSYAVESKDRKTVAAKITETRDEIRISSLGGTTVVVKRRPFLVTVLDADGRTVVEDDPARLLRPRHRRGRVLEAARRVGDLLRPRREGGRDPLARHAAVRDVEHGHLRLPARPRPHLPVHRLLHRAAAGTTDARPR